MNARTTSTKHIPFSCIHTIMDIVFLYIIMVFWVLIQDPYFRVQIE